MRLDVGIVGRKTLLSAIYGQRLGNINVFAAAVVTLARIAFCILIGQDRALGLQHRPGNDILRCDQLDLILLAGKLAHLPAGFRFALEIDDVAIDVDEANRLEHLSADLVDEAIALFRDQKALAPEKPLFLNLAFGAGHAPHQVPRDFIAPYLEVFAKAKDVRDALRIAFGG